MNTDSQCSAPGAGRPAFAVAGPLRISILLLAACCSALTGLAQNRLKDKTEAATPAADDWLYLDGSTNGVRKLSPVYYQVRDADLTSLAAISSTGVLVYRSGANTWSTVTIGTGLQFSGGTLSNTATSFVWGQGTGTLSAQTDLQAALDAKAAADNGTHTGTTTVARADITKVNVPAADGGTIAGAGTLTLTNTNTAYRATFSGATATIALPTPNADGVWRVDGYSTYVGSTQTITIPSLIRPEQDLDTPITSFTVPATSGGRWTAYFFAQAGAFTKVSIIGDTITQRDTDAFHASTAAEFTALANKASPTTSDTIPIEDAAAGNAKRNANLGALPISTATQAALNAKANLAGGNTWTGDQLMDVVRVPVVTLAEQTSPSTPASGYVYFYAKSDGLPYVKDDTGAEIALGVPPHIVIALSDETSDLTTGNAKVTVRAPRAMTLVAVRASLKTASTSGVVTLNIKESGTTIFTTKVTIDQDEKTSVTAATPAVFSDTAIADDAELTFDVDTAGTGAKALKVTLYYR